VPLVRRIHRLEQREEPLVEHFVSFRALSVADPWPQRPPYLPGAV
jgi:hypothetical protein